MNAYAISEAAVADLVLAEADRLAFWRPREGRPYDVFLFGIRGPSARVGLWDDRLGALWWDGRWRVHLAPGTTDPGRDGAGGRLHGGGVAILTAGQHRRLWSPGIHGRGRRSEHRALVQHRTPPVWRDPVGDGRLDDLTGPLHDVTGLNMHGPWREDLERVGDASHGCQVFERMLDLEAVVQVCAMQVETLGVASFSYTLFTLRPHGFERGSPSLAALTHAVPASSRGVRPS